MSFDECGKTLLLNTLDAANRRSILITTNSGLNYTVACEGSAKGATLLWNKDSSTIVCLSCKPLGVFISTNRGASWAYTRSSSHSFDDSYLCTVQGIELNGHLRILAGPGDSEKVLISDDTGHTFHAAPLSLPTIAGEVPQIIKGSSYGQLYACCAPTVMASNSSLYMSMDAGETWVSTNSPRSVWSISIHPYSKVLFLAQYRDIDSAYPNANILFRDGLKWTALGAGVPGSLLWQLQIAADARSMFVVSENGLFKIALN